MDDITPFHTPDADFAPPTAHLIVEAALLDGLRDGRDGGGMTPAR